MPRVFDKASISYFIPCICCLRMGFALHILPRNFFARTLMEKAYAASGVSESMLSSKPVESFSKNVLLPTYISTLISQRNLKGVGNPRNTRSPVAVVLSFSSPTCEYPRGTGVSYTPETGCRLLIWWDGTQKSTFEGMEEGNNKNIPSLATCKTVPYRGVGHSSISYARSHRISLASLAALHRLRPDASLEVLKGERGVRVNTHFAIHD
ncbi:hypothetical protein EDD16DRAFT_573329 [Pisolithus croceorrhizus]|nr:hypothetical protein EDD16DRAFT_573329 [Pisolithus croceorrhizus]